MTWHRSRRKKPTYDLGPPLGELLQPPRLTVRGDLTEQDAAELRARFGSELHARPMVLPEGVHIVATDPHAALDAEMWRRLRAYASSGP